MTDQLTRIEHSLTALQGEIAGIKQTMAARDDLSELEEKMEQGFAGVHRQLNKVEDSVSNLEKKTLQETTAFGGDILKLDRRTTLLEKHAGLPPQPLMPEFS